MRRLRQVALATLDLPAAELAVTGALGVRLCHRDPNLEVFGLENALYPVGDQLLEVVAPIRDGTTAGRLLAKRGGDCGYMVLFQVDDLAPVERRLASAGVRVVYDAQGEGIRGLHLHPSDVPGAIVSIDAADDPAEWPWAGPWREHVDITTAAAICGIDIAVTSPAATADIWAEVLGTVAAAASVTVDDAVVRFVDAAATGREGLIGIDVATPRADLVGSSRNFVGTTLRFVRA